MKKILVSLFAMIIFYSCQYGKVDDNTSIPIEVLKQQNNISQDTCYVIKTEKYHYCFNTNDELVELYSVSNNISKFVPFIIIMFLVGVFIGNIYL